MNIQGQALDTIPGEIPTSQPRMSNPHVAPVLVLGKYPLGDGSYSKQLKEWAGRG